MKKIILIQGSLNPNSKTAVLVKETAKVLERNSIDYEILDLRDLNLQFTDGRQMQDYNEDMQEAFKTLKSSRAVIIGMPVYSYSVSGPLKNFLDIVGRSLKGKYISILTQSGGYRSYLAAADLVKIISFEFFGFPVQPVVHTTYNEFTGNKLTNVDVYGLITEMTEALLSAINHFPSKLSQELLAIT